MSHHNNKPEFSAEQFFKDNARNRGLTNPKTPSRAQMIMYKDSQDRFNNYDGQPTQSGNINEFNELTLALASPGAMIGRAGFELSKSAAKGGLRLVKNLMKRGRNALNTRAGKLVQKHADDVGVIYSVGSQKNKEQR